MRRVALPGLAAAVVALAPAAAHAATITVDTTALDTTENANCTLYEAAEAASTNAAVDDCTAGELGADTIQISVTGPPPITLNNGAIGVPSGEPLEIDGPSSDPFDLFVQAGSAPRIFDADANLTVQNLTLEGVNAASQDGGAIRGTAAVTLTNMVVEGNHISVSGHGACVDAPTILVSGSDFFSNSAQGDGGCLRGGTITVSNSMFTGNSSGASGGAIVSTASTVITNSKFGGTSTGDGNTASGGGGAIALGTGNLSVSGSTFQANKSNSAITSGGAVHSSSSGTVTIADSTFGGIALNHGNQAPAGGALAIDAGTLNASGSTFFSNQATAANGVGGAVAFTGAGGGSIINSSFMQNLAQGGGASIDLSTSGAVTLRHDTMRLNGSPIADIAKDPSGSLTLASSIVASPSGGTECAGTPPTDGGFNDIFPAATAGSCPTTGSNVTGDPDLQPLTANGGPTDTMMLGPASAALDAIPLAQCDVGGDQRGVDRPVGGSCDIGAVEDDYLADGLIAKGTTFAGDDIYNDDGTGQTKSARAKPGHSARFVSQAQNDASLSADGLRVGGKDGNKRFRVTYRSGGDNVTSEVTGSGYDIEPLAAGDSRSVIVKVKVLKGTAAGRHIRLPITVSSASLPVRSDTVVADVTAK